MTHNIQPHDFIIQCHLTQGLVDANYPVLMAHRNSEQTDEITADQANTILDSLVGYLNHDSNLIYVESDDIQAALSVDGPAWIASMRGSGADKAKDASLECLSHPRLGEVKLGDYILASVRASEDLSSEDYEQVSIQIEKHAQPNTHIKLALHFDDAMQDDLIVSFIATGMSAS